MHMALSAGLKVGVPGLWTGQDSVQKVINPTNTRSLQSSFSAPCSTSGVSSLEALSDARWPERRSCCRGSRKQRGCRETVSAILAHPKNTEDTEGWRQRSELFSQQHNCTSALKATICVVVVANTLEEEEVDGKALFPAVHLDI